MTVHEKAFQLTTIAQFILARVPMIAGYVETTTVTDSIIELSRKIGGDTEKILNSEEWSSIQKILGV